MVATVPSARSTMATLGGLEFPRPSVLLDSDLVIAFRTGDSIALRSIVLVLFGVFFVCLMVLMCVVKLLLTRAVEDDGLELGVTYDHYLQSTIIST